MLPLGGDRKRGDNGVGNIGRVNPSVAYTLLWCIISICAMVFGIWHCRASSFSDSFICNEIECKLMIGNDKDVDYTIHREGIKHIEVVRVDAGNKVANWYHLAPKEVGKLGHNAELRFMHSVDAGDRYQVQKEALLSHRDMGRGKSRAAYNQIFEYMQKRRDKVEVRNESHLSVIGVLSIAVGAFSLLMSCIAGQWSDPVPRRQKKQY